MLSGIACGLLLLLLLGGVDVALAVNAFPRFVLLALGAVPLLVSLLVTNETLVYGCSRTAGSALISLKRSWYSGFRRVCQQHCPAAWSPQQSLI